MATEDMPEVPLSSIQPSKEEDIGQPSEPIKEPIAELAEAPVKQESKKASVHDPEADDEEDDEVLDLPAVPTSPVRRKQEEALEKRKSKPRGTC
jgi:hypothetical protein